MNPLITKALGFFLGKVAEKAVDEVVEHFDDRPQSEDDWSMAKKQTAAEAKKARRKRQAQRRARRKKQ